ncbi:DNA-binding protein, partial [Salmonella enterica]|uniref:DNA-binding protein n=1 Tax=Salmonella enterica TaxID=28901 RepID=UPI0021513F43
MILRQCAGTMTVESIGRLIGRTGRSVRTKARKLRVCMIRKGDFPPPAKYRQGDIERARQLHRCGVPRREIAEKLEMPLGMINQYVYFERRVYEV